MIQPISVEAQEEFRIRIRYEDGVDGVVDLSHLAHRGVFSIWDDPAVFQHVYIDSESHAIAWSKEVELCPDALYLKIIGKPFSTLDLQEGNASYARAV